MQFLLDVMCGGLVSYLRMCNYDTVYAGDRELEADDELLALGRNEGRTLVTRDVELANRAARPTDEPRGAILLESLDVEDQLRELTAAGVELTLPAEPAVCSRCNGSLERVGRGESTPEYAPDAEETPLWRCRSCQQHFWRGSHWDRVQATLSELSTDTE
ncbi:hypothetical protein SAMN04487967_2234 [Natronorubrum sediminis]|uniref:Mut7-C RNAse domain-containing protein n=1 Tax=Natronorubrum sediminis TaxID=640943 RepID=A0A1H6G0H0_9EURY|nr:Mut7-C RNAse domain-containing protein [Natronorubrum sediminis]SEH15773.1 hypothetical protein SAMN04487967_2234 [Natronorubrum sediminis]